MAYFASRAAPLGPVPSEVVTATFYNFAPRMVARAIPDAWALATPAAILRARHDAVRAALERILPTAARASLAAVVERLREGLAACDVAGRPLYAANAALPWPEEPASRLWHAATLLREHRGDGHVIALQAHGIDGCEAHHLAAAAGTTTSTLLRAHRGWTDEEWDAAAQRLRDRGLLDRDGGLTGSGRALHEDLERLTDRLATPPWAALDEEAIARVEGGLTPVLEATAAAGAVPYPNAMGLPPPAAEPER